MTSREDYFLKAAGLLSKAEAETNPRLRDEFQNLATAYLRLAEQAMRNTRADIVYEQRAPKTNDQK